MKVYKLFKRTGTEYGDTELVARFNDEIMLFAKIADIAKEMYPDREYPKDYIGQGDPSKSQYFFLREGNCGSFYLFGYEVWDTEQGALFHD